MRISTFKTTRFEPNGWQEENQLLPCLHAPKHHNLAFNSHISAGGSMGSSKCMVQMSRCAAHPSFCHIAQTGGCFPKLAFCLDCMIVTLMNLLMRTSTAISTWASYAVPRIASHANVKHEKHTLRQSGHANQKQRLPWARAQL